MGTTLKVSGPKFLALYTVVLRIADAERWWNWTLIPFVLQDTDAFLSADGAAMKSAAQIVSEWRGCLIGSQLMRFEGITHLSACYLSQLSIEEGLGIRTKLQAQHGLEMTM